MRILQLAFSTAAFALVTAAAGGAFADVAPPDECTGAVGSACNNAGPNADQPGVCTNEMCPETLPGPDGGVMTTENPCVLCEPTGAGGGSGTTGSGAASGSGGSASSSSGGGGGGCSIAIQPGNGVIAGTMLMVGLGALLADRRRRRRG
jgi:hypothetical protein